MKQGDQQEDLSEDPNTVSKKRAPNYTNNEKELLLNIIEQHKHVIENKKTDGVSVKEKKETWQKICQQFNTSSPNLYYRPVDSLKNFYEKMKEELRKKTAEMKKELYKTGGGRGSGPQDNQQDDLLMSIINKKSVLGLGSKFDSNNGRLIIESDSNYTQDSVKKTFTSIRSDIKLLEVEDATKEDPLIQQGESEISLDIPTCNYDNNNIEIVYEESQEPSECLPSHLWKKGEHLKRPISNVLKDNVNKTVQASRKKIVPSRRRPNTVVTLTSSKLGEKYEMLVDKKIELAECLKQEHKLRMQALELDILLKKKQLASAGTEQTDELLLESPMLC